MSKKHNLNTGSGATLPYKSGTEQEYGLVKKILGGNWIQVLCADNHLRRCHIRGALQRFKKNSTKIECGDYILLSKRDDKNGDVVLKYPQDVARKMKKQGEIVINDGTDDANNDNDGVEFIDPAEESFDFNTI